MTLESKEPSLLLFTFVERKGHKRDLSLPVNWCFLLLSIWFIKVYYADIEIHNILLMQKLCGLGISIEPFVNNVLDSNENERLPTLTMFSSKTVHLSNLVPTKHTLVGSYNCVFRPHLQRIPQTFLS